MSAVLQPPPRPVWTLAIAAVLLSIVTRFLKLPNFTAFGALSLYAGARLPLWAAFSLPIGGMLLTDYLMRLQPSWSTYGCYLLSIGVGMLLRRTNSVWKIGIAALVMNLLFFFVTNLVAWYGMRGSNYEDSIQGAMTAVVAGIPFYTGTFFGDALFVPLFFLSHAFADRTAIVPQEIKS